MNVGESRRSLRGAQAALERRAAPARAPSSSRRRRASASPSPGACRTSAGTCRSSPAQHIPIDRRATRTRRKPVPALLDAIRFPSDPAETILEANDVAVLLRSDPLDHIAAGAKALFDELDLFRVTSIRKGFAGGGFDGGQSLPKRMAVAAQVGGSYLIPDRAELFLGFTSTQKAGLGPPRIANVEELGFSAGGYFARGTHSALSHITEDLEAWYVNFAHAERVATVFRPGLEGRRRSAHRSAGPRRRRRRRRRRPRASPARSRSATRPRSRRPRGWRRPPSERAARSTDPARRFRTAPTSTRSTTRSSGAPSPGATG